MPNFTGLLEAIGRLLVAIAGCGRVRQSADDLVVELTDDINDLAYKLEHDKDI